MSESETLHDLRKTLHLPFTLYPSTLHPLLFPLHNSQFQDILAWQRDPATFVFFDAVTGGKR